MYGPLDEDLYFDDYSRSFFSFTRRSVYMIYVYVYSICIYILMHDESARAAFLADPATYSRGPPAPPVARQVPAVKATWKGGFKRPWREAGPPHHHDDNVDSDK